MAESTNRVHVSPGIYMSETVDMKAAAKSGLGESKADVLPLVMKSITEGEWVDYNRDGARVLYAEGVL